MRLPALRHIELQAAYPSQAEGGFAGDLHNSLHRALVAWEKKRNPEAGFKYGRNGSQYRREKTATATREEISWNSAPEVKAPSNAQKKKKQRESNLKYMRSIRAKETPQERAERLEKRRAARGSVSGRTYKQRPKMTPEQRKAAVKAAKARYVERQRLGLVAKTVRPPSKLTVDQLAKKAARQREYEAANKVIRTA